MRFLLCFLVLCSSHQVAHTQEAQRVRTPDPSLLRSLEELSGREQWSEILRVIPDSTDNAPDLDYYRGMALAAVQRWPEAQAALGRGMAKAPRDKRFPLELAGISFKLGQRSASRKHLHRAMQLDPGDSYAAEFLATLHYLDGNQEAAVQYWNRAGKPLLEEVETQPLPRLDPVILDRCFTFAPASLLKLRDLRSTRARLDSLEVFSTYRLELVPRKDGKFDVMLRPAERNGWGGSTTEAVVSLLRGIPYQTVLPEYYNFKGSAHNLRGLARWDEKKERAYASVSGPIARDPAWRYLVQLDARDEDWDISRSVHQDAEIPAPFRLRSVKAAVGIDSLVGARYRWSTTVEAGSRHYRGAPQLPPEGRQFFATGVSLRQSARLEHLTLSVPEHRFSLQSFGTGQWGKILSGAGRPYGSVGGGLKLAWSPHARGSDYQVEGRLSAAKGLGETPFDELYSLGLERDNALYLRGHKDTRDGRKGSGPIGQDFFLMNMAFSKSLYKGGLWGIVLTPFVDTGKTFDSSGYFGSREWQWDVGVQLRLLFFERVSLVLSYGKDLRSGRNSFYTTTY